MRRSVKYRLLFLLSAIVIYCIGFQWLPESMQGANALGLTIAIAASYFVLLPAMYAYCIIYVGQQHWWKMLVVFSLSSLMARFSFPAELASYFEFIAWLRYPIIAVLLLLQVTLVYRVIKSLWQGRKLPGDPRLHIHDAVQGKVLSEKALQAHGVAMTLAMEVVNWFYALNHLTRQHPQSLCKLQLLSASPWHYLLANIVIISSAVFSYWLLASWSMIAAILVSSFIGYCLVMARANYRLARYYSVYIHQQYLVVNAGVWGFTMLPLSDIEEVNVGNYGRNKAVTNKHSKEQINNIHKTESNNEQLHLGRGESNVQIKLKSLQRYYGAMSMLPEDIEQLYLHVDKPEAISQLISVKEAA
ncbi:hypothetical protein L2747_13215 [Shewanella marinintestina]|uniref:hypothetical protein n=1 Tax=Shewanella marinintestina TaxID=190305 RepID=UPI00200EBC6A|nr:hypothetical protein [Shewanella marinintestina]MCL1146959.1 hypothetical protein [Shewanella marinintestina]